MYPMTGINQRFNAAQTAEITAEGRRELTEAIRAELRRALDAEDFGVKELYKISSLAAAGHALIGDPLTRMNNMIGGLSPSGLYETGLYQTSLPASMQSMSPSSSDENFGATAIQQLIPALAKRNNTEESSVELLEAARVARDLGDIELSSKLVAKVSERLTVATPAKVCEDHNHHQEQAP